MSGHTKGPWAVNDGINPGFRIVSSKTRDITYVTLRDPEERAANARLIAAAPELLELARDNLGTLEEQRRAHVRWGKPHNELDTAIEQTRAAIAKAVQP